MKTFLNIVASDLLRRFGNNLRNVTVVFPGKRASIFLNQELALISKEPVWTPRYATMGSLFGRLTDLATADSIDSICSLYQVYCEVMKDDTPETLDKFWSWGEVILSDFDDIDKHLANAEAVFSNIKELKELESFDYLTDEQRKVLGNFFSNFQGNNDSVIKERFLRVWSRMYEMYTRLRERQMQDGVVYEGALFRMVVEDINRDETVLTPLLEGAEAIVFAGFNVLNDVEKAMMTAIQKAGKALFYWDYDSFYVNNLAHEAGVFMRENLKDYPSAVEKEEFDNLCRLKDVTFVSTTSDNATARYARDWFSVGHDDVSNHNAVILCNEGLLQPVLHSMPDDAGSVNVTMGFPLTDTPIYSLVTALMSLQTDGFDHKQKRFRFPFVKTVRHHVYASLLREEDWLQYHAEDCSSLLRYLVGMVQAVGLSYQEIAEPDIYEQLYIEAIFQTNRILQKLLQMIECEEKPLVIQHVTLRRLLRSLLCSTSIPFHGEPANGLQVMGVLETRCLDFSHMLMLSVEEGMLPRNTNANTMIPANIREAFGLTTPRHRIAVFSYYFYRLIQRTEHLTCVYNENCSGNTRHEMSRFLRQMLAETNIPVQTKWQKNEPQISTSEDISVEKTPEVVRQMLEMYDQNAKGKRHITLSPSAINTYMKCQLKFYLANISRLRKNEEATDELDLPLIGDIFHDTAQVIYDDLSKRTPTKTIDKNMLSTILADMEKHVGPLLDIIFDVRFFHAIEDDKEREKKVKEMVEKGTRPGNQYTGELIIIRKVLMKYLENLIRYDSIHAPFNIVGTEINRTIEIEVQPEGWPAPVTIRTGGRIDRLDKMDDHLRIVDYKTGSHMAGIRSLDDVTKRSPDFEGYYFQTFLYSLAAAEAETSQFPVKPVLFYPGKAYGNDYDPSLFIGKDKQKEVVDDFRKQVEKPFREGLEQIIGEMFSPQTPFSQTDDEKTCQNCDFKQLCGRYSDK